MFSFVLEIDELKVKVYGTSMDTTDRAEFVGDVGLYFVYLHRAACVHIVSVLELILQRNELSIDIGDIWIQGLEVDVDVWYLTILYTNTTSRRWG